MGPRRVHYIWGSNLFLRLRTVVGSKSWQCPDDAGDESGWTEPVSVHSSSTKITSYKQTLMEFLGNVELNQGTDDYILGTFCNTKVLSTKVPPKIFDHKATLSCLVEVCNLRGLFYLPFRDCFLKLKGMTWVVEAVTYIKNCWPSCSLQAIRQLREQYLLTYWLSFPKSMPQYARVAC